MALEPAAGEGVFATFELPEQVVGFPFLTVEAPAGTVVELMTQEAHDLAGAALARHAPLLLVALRLPRG